MGIFNKGIAVVGSTTIDEIVSPGSTVTKIGGVTAYGGITYSRHGIDTYVVSNISNKDQEIIERLEQEKISIINGQTNQTTRFVNDIRKDKGRQKVLDRASPIKLHQLLAISERIDGCHLGPLHPDDIAAEVPPSMPRLGIQIFLDIQGYTRKAVSNRVTAAVSKDLSSGLKAAHIIKANGAELKLVMDHYQKDLTEIMTCFEIKESVITLGQKGGWVQTLKGEKFKYSADRIECELDPTGAGDVFFAAYLLGRFVNNKDVPDACRYAAATAARQVEGRYISVERLVLP